MARACDKCGAPAADNQSQFCNRCGGPVKDLPDSALPVCKKCGFPALDTKSEFCTRCGSRFTGEPQTKLPVCRNCGHEIPDPEAGFCNRCGTPSRGPGAGVKPAQAPEPVVLAKRRHAVTPETAADWSPFSEDDEGTGAVQALLDRKKRGRLPIGPGAAGDLNGSPPEHGYPLEKKYAHLPLVSDEMRALKPDAESLLPDDGSRGAKKTDSAGKKGLMNFFKKKQG
ncbi:MAG: Double zinc ribbon [Methanoregula sp. PtaU1.Bin051]|nr:MAG: Double zinc ribbon [Methanoregula sp. PtaU1.Bin051]